MRTFIPILFLLSTILASCATPPSSPEPAPVSPTFIATEASVLNPEPASVSHTFIATEASILNPERGFLTPYTLPGPAEFSPVRATGNTLVHLNILLDDWRAADIPE